MLTTREIRLNEYLGLVGAFEPGWLYHDEAWLASVRDGFGAEVLAYVTESPEGEAVALTPAIRIRKAVFKLIGSPLRGMYTEFAGPLFSAGADEKSKRAALASQHSFIRGHGAGYIEWGWRGGEETGYMHVLQRMGYEYTPRQTLVVDLEQGADKVWAGFESRARNMVRKGEKNGLTVCSVVPDVADIQNYYAMLTETFRRQGGRPLHPLSFFLAICGRLVPSGQLKFISAVKDGHVVAGAIFLCHAGRMMYLSGTSNEEGAKLAANSLIQWVAMKQAIEAGIGEYDLGGTGNARIDKFKASFGGKPLDHHRWVYRTLPVKLAEAGYNWLVGKGLVRFHG